MNPGKVEALVYRILNHYKSIGGYKMVPHDLDDCTSANRSILLIELVSKIGVMGYYHQSITIDSRVSSSISGELLILNPLPIEGLYWIRRSQGYDNAHIIAHLHSWGGDGESLSAFVAR